MKIARRMLAIVFQRRWVAARAVSNADWRAL
ncbi:MAG: hypothetical protein AVDCRST_MAG87-2250 [uncultured Thermomicrobiales bacterium]|uniref:Uncharacterized protein n=1 Tax=uncultured Thermomicrobiales bacterium TaxID=1645740 RepID=A0A6J4V883_9BACT|nr:MAG: hypothetical protein AVDCRST_MAG87-2250 [uncultured Thermomicrobiales bacterium]